jgi:hypothetical protein
MQLGEDPVHDALSGSNVRFRPKAESRSGMKRGRLGEFAEASP